MDKYVSFLVHKSHLHVKTIEEFYAKETWISVFRCLFVLIHGTRDFCFPYMNFQHPKELTFGEKHDGKY